ncbi:MAG: RNA polymerase sigma-70 factor [Microscillaceae bacterium]|nr:RNA polymerase sigma-70 factor [Microscillaceae bacterium]
MDQEEKTNFQAQTLLAALRKGDEQAFQQIYLHYWKELFAYAFNILRNQALCEDVIQDVFIAVWINRQDTQILNLKAYLYHAVRNKALSQLRKVKLTGLQQEVIEKLSLNESADQALHLKDIEQSIRQAADKLAPRCREIFFLSRFDRLSNQEIAQKLSISLRSVENQLSIALKYLREQVNDPRVSLFIILHFIK